ncbi:alpha/beta fold hydrolase [Aquimarina sp. AU474]|uniref:alpha/beta fold hydrolase n=1 Tax=Aquimarina sp. AU474 TaxID=2108529 RepID=UPI000D694655|nr:alpha/beta hydrolase [Aquimarina sp. AU474]
MRKYHIVFVICLYTILACKNNIKDQEKTISDVNNKSGSIVIDGTTLNYSIKGKGTPFLLIGSDPEYFSKDFLNNFRLYSIEMRFNAKEYEPIDLSEYNIDNLFKDIDTLRSVLGLEKFIIGGHSVLGAVAHKYAKKHPKYVSHVVMMATPRTWGTTEYKDSVKTYWENASEKRKLLYNEKLKQFEKEKNDTLNRRELFIKSLVASGPKRWHDENLDATQFFERVNYNLDFLYHLFGKVMPKYDLCSPKEKIDIPVFAAIGKSDYIAPSTLWHITCKESTRLTVSLFEKSGHTPQYEQSELFNKRLVDWIQRN